MDRRNRIIPPKKPLQASSLVQTLMSRIILLFRQLNPANWFNELRNIDISIEEDFVKRSRWGN